MNFIEMIKMRRSVYNLNKQLPIFEDKMLEIVNDAVRYVPDAFNMKSQRVVVIVGRKNDEFWNAVYDSLVVASGGRFSPNNHNDALTFHIECIGHISHRIIHDF